MVRTIQALSFCLLLLACQRSNQTTPNPQPPAPAKPGERGAAAKTIEVIGETGQPLANAKVLIGSAKDQPFAGNYLTTDSHGSLAVPGGWTTSLPVTIEGAGHIRTTFLNQSPGAQTYKVHALKNQNSREIKGLATGIQPFMKEKDGYVDFALVSPVVELQDVFLFNVSQALSPEKDTISVLGKELGLPSNLSLPNQKEKVSIVSFTLDKPLFRFRHSGAVGTAVVAIRGRAQVSALVENKGPMLVNAVEFLGAGTRLIEAGSNLASFDVAVNQMSNTAKAEVVAPAFSNTEMMTSVALAKFDDNHLFLTDIKIHESNEKRSLLMPPNKGMYYVFLWSKKDVKQSQAASMMLAKPGQARIDSKFLPLVARPSLNGMTLTVAPPTTVSGVKPGGMLVSLSDTKITTMDGEIQAERPIRKWDFYSADWISQVQIPVWPDATAELTNTRRWEAIFIGRSASELAPVDPYDFTGATHATRNYIDLTL